MDGISVSMIIQGYPPMVGGAERQLASMIPVLKDLGCRVHVITRKGPGLPSFEVVDGVPVHRIRVPGSKPLASLMFTLGAMRLLKALSPHVIHAHELLSPATTAVVAKRLFAVPVIVKVLRGGLLGDLAKLKRKPFGRRRIVAFRKHVDAFVAISREIDSELEEMGVPGRKRHFIPNGVDTVRFSPVIPSNKEWIRTSLRLPVEPIVLYSGRLSAEKRVDQLISVWPLVRKIHRDATLVLLGTGPEEGRLKSMAGRGILFRGVVDNVSDYLRCADLFVLPSITEGLSNSMLEAMSTGVCVLATSVGAAPELLEDGQNGRLIEPDRPEALEEALIQLLNNRQQRMILGNLARLRVIENYSLPRVAQKIRNLYESVLSDGIVPSAKPGARRSLPI